MDTVFVFIFTHRKKIEQKKSKIISQSKIKKILIEYFEQIEITTKKNSDHAHCSHTTLALS